MFMLGYIYILSYYPIRLIPTRIFAKFINCSHPFRLWEQIIVLFAFSEIHYYIYSESINKQRILSIIQRITRLDQQTNDLSQNTNKQLKDNTRNMGALRNQWMRWDYGSADSNCWKSRKFTLGAILLGIS